MTWLNGETRNTMTIVIVTARQDCFVSVKTALASPVLELVRVDSVDEFLNIHLDRGPVIILLDGLIDRTGGLQAAEVLRSDVRYQSIPLVFIVSARVQTPCIFKGHDHGTVDYLLEPMMPRILQAKVAIFQKLNDLHLQLESKRRELDDKNLEIEVLQKELEERNRVVEEFSSLDGLTGLFNRRYFNDNVLKEWKQAIRTQAQLSLLLVEIEIFTGQAGWSDISAGDDWRRRIAQGLYEALLRPVDIIARYDTDVFAAILPGTGRQGVESVAMRMMANVAGPETVQQGSVTFSLGATTLLPNNGLPVTALFDYAAKALQEAKAAGGNVLRICAPETT